MATTVIYSGADYTSYTTISNLSIEDRLDSRNTASMTFVDSGTGTPSAPAIGAPVQIGDRVDSTCDVDMAVDDSEVEITVTDSTVFAVADFVMVGTEVWKVTAKVDSTHVTVERGAMGTTKAEHSDGDDVYDWAAYFAGSVDTINTVPQSPDTIIQYNLTLVDWNQILDRFLVANNFNTTDQTAGDICKSIVNDTGLFPQTIATDTLNGLEGVTAALTTDTPAGFVSPGIKIEDYLFNYDTVAACFSQMADTCGFVWSLNYNKELVFGPNLGTATTITQGNRGTYIIAGSISKSQSRDQFRNQQFLRGGMNPDTAVTETFAYNVSAGYATALTLQNPVGADIADADIEDNVSGSWAAVNNGVGIKNVTTGKSCYYQIGSNHIEVDAALGITTDKSIRVTYRPQVPVMTFSTNEGSVESRKTAEGNSGMYAFIETTPDVNALSGFDRGRALVNRFGVIPQTVTFQSDTLTFEAGNKQTVTLTALGLSAQGFIIVSRSIKDINGKQFRATYVLEDELHRRDWIDWYTKIYRNQLRTHKQNDVLQYVRSYSETSSRAKPWVA